MALCTWKKSPFFKTDKEEGKREEEKNIKKKNNFVN